MDDYDKIPVLIEGTKIKIKEGQCYIKHPTLTYLLLDNDVAIDILKQCNGKNSIAQISENITNNYDNVSHENARSDAYELLCNLKDEEFITLK